MKGTVTYGSGELNLPGMGKHPNGFPVWFIIGPKLESKDASESAGVTPKALNERSIEEKLKEAVRKLKVEELASKEENAEKFEELYEALMKEYGDHLPLLMARLRYFDQKEKRTNMLESIIESADKILSQILEEKLVAPLTCMLTSTPNHLGGI